MTSQEKYEALEAKKIKYETEYASLYARIDALRVKMNVVEKEAQEAFKKYMSEKINKK
jgi:hypothetical protein